MKFLKGFQVCAAVLCALLAAVPTVEARTKKGDKFFKEAVKAEDAKDWDTALVLYDQALETDTKDAGYLMADQRIHSKAAQVHLAEGKELLRAQKLEQALAQFQKSFLADPGSQIALQQIRDVTEMMKERSRLPAGTPVYTSAERSRMEIERRINALEGPPTLRPINNQISSLKMNNQPARVLYESVSKLAGINVLFDPTGINSAGGGNNNFNLDLNNVTLEEALNYISLVTHTFWKPISHNAIFVSQESEQKRREYQDEVVKVFYVQNASTPNEFTEIFNGVRIGSKLQQGVFQVASQNAIIARGSPDTIALVEKLVHDLDKAKAEVTMDVIIMEVNKNKTSTIGAALLGQGGLSAPLNYTPRNPTPGTTSSSSSSTGTTTGSTTGTTTTGTTTTGTTATIAQLGHFSSADYSATLPSTIVQALMNDTSTHILQRPQLRATDGGKASLKIGAKIPYVSGSLNSAVATPGALPYATTQFQQVDIGTNIDLAPHVNGADDISMHVKVEILTELAQISIAGINEPEIGQQVDEADIRMRDGEVSILGGLSDRESSNTLAGLPGFTNIPLLGYLFGTRTKSNQDNEILIAVIPHITRAPDLTNLAEEGVYAGTEAVSHVLRKTEPAAGAPSASGPSNQMPRTIMNGGPMQQPFQPQQAQPQPNNPAPANPVPLNPPPAASNPQTAPPAVFPANPPARPPSTGNPPPQ